MHVRRRERKHLLPRQTEAANARFQTESSVCGAFAAEDAAGLQKRLRSRHEEFSSQVRSSSNASVDALPPIDRLGSIHLRRLSPSSQSIRSKDQLHACSALVPRQSQPRLVRVPEPGEQLDLTVSQHRDSHAAMVATWRGARRPATVGQILLMQLTNPLAPQMAALGLRFQAVVMRLRGIPVTPRTGTQTVHTPAVQGTGWSTGGRSLAPL
jgi:hypothetical protein